MNIIEYRFSDTNNYIFFIFMLEDYFSRYRLLGGHFNTLKIFHYLLTSFVSLRQLLVTAF